MSFNGNEGEPISLEEAAEMTARYRKDFPDATQGHFFGTRILSRILKQKHCKGIRMYYGIDEKGHPQLVLVGADREENDQTQGLIADISVACPPTCGEKNALNS